MEKSAQYYAKKAFIAHTKEGERYAGLNQVIFLAFCDFNVFPESKGYKHEHVRENKYINMRKLGKFSYTFINLPKFAKTLSKPLTDLTLEEKFYYCLCHPEEILNKELTLLIGKNKVIKKVFEELKPFNWSEEELESYDYVEKGIKDYRETLGFYSAQGEAEGIKLGERKIVKRLLSNGMTKPQVAKALNLRSEALNALIAEKAA